MELFSTDTVNGLTNVSVSTLLKAMMMRENVLTHMKRCQHCNVPAFGNALVSHVCKTL
jgi:hypothetical protein